QQSQARLADWNISDPTNVNLLETVANARPSILVGVTGQPGVFTKQVVQEMAAHCERPIIFPLSNPTSRCEALPADVVAWTAGRALIASGSPFAPVPFEGREIPIAQCNNSYIFPAMGLGILASQATRVTDGMFMAAALALRDGSPALHAPHASLLPPLEDIRTLARHIALQVGLKAQEDGVAERTTREQLDQRIDQKTWIPEYRSS
ncbi:MAG: malic enzyme-like NAD(P)-binding protein, partial [Planctomycetota bacterium]